MCLDLYLDDVRGLLAGECVNRCFPFVSLDHLVVACGEHGSPLLAIDLMGHDVLDEFVVGVDVAEVVA